MLDLDAIKKAHLGRDKIGTHSEKCYLWHRECAIARLIEEVERLDRANNEYMLAAVEREFGTKG